MNKEKGTSCEIQLEQYRTEERYKALLELYTEKCDEYTKLFEEHIILSKDHKILREKNAELSEKNAELSEEHEKLKHEYSENTIIQSMNAMKEQYEELIASTVAKFRYDMVNERLQSLNRVVTTCSVILEHATTSVRNISERFLYGGQNKLELQKIGFELSMLSEILIGYETQNE